MLCCIVLLISIFNSLLLRMDENKQPESATPAEEEHQSSSPPAVAEAKPKVEVEPFDGRKQWLGGYKHKTTNATYHNAEAQTNRQTTKHASERNTRDTQTSFQRNKAFNTPQNAATQMTKPGVYVSTAHDRLVTPGEYTLAAVIEKRREEAAIVIQKHFRRYMAEQTVAQLKTDLAKFEEWVAKAKESRVEQKEDRKAENLRRRLNPRTEKDFELVWHALEQWREEQVALINETTATPAETKAALATLQEQVAQLVAAIGRHRTRAADEQKVT